MREWVEEENWGFEQVWRRIEDDLVVGFLREWLDLERNLSILIAGRSLSDVCFMRVEEAVVVDVDDL